MKYISTRGSFEELSFSTAMVKGLAPDGGLYVPKALSRIHWKDFRGASYPELAAKLLRPFLADDELEVHLDEICREAFDFPVPLKYLKQESAVLELFHGPTCAFKDFGARFLATCFKRLPGEKRTILVATSGDTGGAVASAFFKNPQVQVGVLFPQGQVSERQEKQLTCWGENIKSFSVKGDFDACQKLVKEAFMDVALRSEFNLTSANSINIGRLLPQMTYYAWASIEYHKANGMSPSFVIPTGNLGNAMGAIYAREIGFPIHQLALATNANHAVGDFLSSGNITPRPSISTLANAMDVGLPSNLERLRFHYPAANQRAMLAYYQSVSDDLIRATIIQGEKTWGEIWCPHTATAVYLREQIKEPHWIVVSTAHPAKFEGVVEPLIGHRVQVPDALNKLLLKDSSVTPVEPKLKVLAKYLRW